MDSSQTTIGNDNVLEQALRTYEESERSLKSICYSVEQENIQLQNQLKQLQTIYNNRIQQSKQIQQQIHLTQKDFHLLNQQMSLFHQQTNSFHQRYEQVQLAIKQILASSLSSDDHVQQQTYPALHFKLLPIYNSNSTDHSQSNHFNNKRKLTNQHSTPKHHKTKS